MRPAHVGIMGVAGAGKSTLGRLLAARLGRPFLDADDFHTPAARAAMASGLALTDSDRAPWLAAIADALSEGPAVLACSALKAAYRERLEAGGGSILWVHLDGPAEVIAQRIVGRADHFFPADLLDTQFAILEPPATGLSLDVRHAPEELAHAVIAALEATGP